MFEGHSGPQVPAGDVCEDPEIGPGPQPASGRLELAPPPAGDVVGWWWNDAGGSGRWSTACLNSWAKLKRCRTSGSAPFSTISVLKPDPASAISQPCRPQPQ